MRILIINRFFGGQQTPTGRMAWDVAKELRRQGHEVAVLVSQSKYAGAQGAVPGEAERFEITFVRELPGGRLAQWGSFWFRSLLALTSRRWDCCIVLTDPPFLPFAAWLTQCFRRADQRVYWWTMDLYPEALVAAGMIREESVANRLLRRFNAVGIRSLHGVISLGERQLKRLQTYRGWNCTPEFAAVVPPWDYRPLAKVNPADNRVLKQIGGPGVKIALYTGNLGEGHLFEPFVEAARWFQNQRRTDWKFVFVVRGSGRNEFETMSAGLSNLEIREYFPETETAALLWSATVHLVSMKPGWEGVIVPSKLYGAFQTEAPVLFIGPLDSDTTKEIETYNRGLSLLHDATGEKIANALDNLAEPKWVQETRLNGAGSSQIARFITD